MKVLTVFKNMCRRNTGYFMALGVFFVMLGSSGVFAANIPSNVSSSFEQAGKYFQKGDYKAAIDEYQRILDEGYESGPLYYNLAGAYFKSGKIGEAILNYSRAERLIPRDADLNANMRYARSDIKTRVFENNGLWSWRPLKTYADSFTIDELTVLTSAFFFALIGLILLWIVKPELRKNLLALGLLVSLLVSSNIFIIWHKAGMVGRYAIVTSAETDAMFGPFETATKFFKLYEGVDVVVLKSENGWYKIRRSDGKIGWVKKDTLEIV